MNQQQHWQRDQHSGVDDHRSPYKAKNKQQHTPGAHGPPRSWPRASPRDREAGGQRGHRGALLLLGVQLSGHLQPRKEVVRNRSVGAGQRQNNVSAAVTATVILMASAAETDERAAARKQHIGSDPESVQAHSSSNSPPVNSSGS